MIKNIIDSTREFVLELLQDELPTAMCFHNMQHTQEVVQASIEIAEQCHFSPKQLEIVTLAAWFHDCGYTKAFLNHEASSIYIAGDFLCIQRYPEADAARVLACIEATRFPQHAESPEEKVLADADLYHFSRKNYLIYAERLRQEFTIFLDKNFTDQEWASINYEVLEKHRYYTSYGKEVLQKRKEDNLHLLKTICCA